MKKNSKKQLLQKLLKLKMILRKEKEQTKKQAQAIQKLQNIKKLE